MRGLLPLERPVLPQRASKMDSTPMKLADKLTKKSNKYANFIDYFKWKIWTLILCKNNVWALFLEVVQLEKQ